MNLILRSEVGNFFEFGIVMVSPVELFSFPKSLFQRKIIPTSYFYFSHYSVIFSEKWKGKRKNVLWQEISVFLTYISQKLQTVEKKELQICTKFFFEAHCECECGQEHTVTEWLDRSRKVRTWNVFSRSSFKFNFVDFEFGWSGMIWFSEIYLWVRRVKSAWRVKTSCTQIVLVSFILILLFNLPFAFLNNEICEERTISLHC